MKLFELFKKEAALESPIEMPESFVRLDPMPDDPKHLAMFATQTGNCIAIANVRPLGRHEYHMPFGDPQAVIDGIHLDHDDDQGLIEVNAFATDRGYRGIYSIVKTVLGIDDDGVPGGVQYGLLLHMDTDLGPVSVHAFFEECGMTGLREAAIVTAMRQAGKVGPELEGWACDPYDPEHTRGIPMNLSEYRDFDPAFPEHPLTVCRNLVDFLVEAY